MPNTNPTFLGGHTPARADTQWAIQQKILGALIDGGGSSGGLSGTGSPLNTVTPTAVSQIYVNTDAPHSLWISVGLTNADWVEFVSNITP